MHSDLIGAYAAIEALRGIEEKLLRAGAVLPVEVKGTIESAVKTGLSIALCLVVSERETKEKEL